MQTYAMAMPVGKLILQIAPAATSPGDQASANAPCCLFWHQACRFGPEFFLSFPLELWAMRHRLSTCLAVLALALSAFSARAETVVRYGISMADIPLTTGQPDRGAGAYQFTAYTIYELPVAWSMDVADR